jgi:HK97 family phage major capsid protein
MEDELFLDEAKHVRKCLEKWDKAVGRFEDKSTKAIMAQIYENQWKVQERVAHAIREGDQTTTTFGVSIFPNSVVYPLIDQVFPNLIAMQIALVKPMMTSTASVPTKTRKFSADESAFTHTGSNASTLELGTIPLGRTVWTSSTVTAEKYALRARYSLETVEDALRDGDINFESEMMRDLADEIIGEIDYVVLQAMFIGASAGNVAYSTEVHSNETVKEHQQELWDAIVDANNLVFAGMQKNANFIVGDATSIGRLEKLMNFAFVPGARDDVFNAGSVRVGTLNNQYAVFKSTMAPANKLLVGVAKESYLYAPYIPLELSTPVYEPETDEAQRVVRTRFGKKLLRGEALATVTIS